jgi:hypothetical protein
MIARTGEEPRKVRQSRRPETVNELLHGGDWACAHGDGEDLAVVAEMLAERLGPALAARARRVAELAEDDPLRASREWGALASTVRLELGCC